MDRPDREALELVAECACYSVETLVESLAGQDGLKRFGYEHKVIFLPHTIQNIML